MGQQGGRICWLRRRVRDTRGGESAIGDGGTAGRRRESAGRSFPLHRFRGLQRLQASSPAREVRQRHARPGHCLGRRVENAAGETSIRRRGVNCRERLSLGDGASPD